VTCPFVDNSDYIFIIRCFGKRGVTLFACTTSGAFNVISFLLGCHWPSWLGLGLGEG